MSTTQQTVSKRTRGRKPQHGGPSSRSIVSENEAYTTINEQSVANGDGKPKQRRKSHAARKGYAQSDAAAQSDGPSQRAAQHPAKTQATPIKQQAYAGPTFHQSPAASSLPMPSFYSRSVPSGHAIQPGFDSPQKPENATIDAQASAPASSNEEVKRESTPLDFLFDAARKAHHTPGAESPNNKHHYLSSAADTPVSKSPAARDTDGEFPFELESGDQVPWGNTSTYSTPYKERIEAIRTNRTSSTGGKSLDEEERKAKTAALKKFLVNSAQTQGDSGDNNPFNARSAPANDDVGPRYQHRSMPNTPYNHNGYNNQYFPQMPPVPQMPQLYMPTQYQSPNRPGPSSNLRNIYQPSPVEAANKPSGFEQLQEQPLISTARDQIPTSSKFGDIYSTPSKQSQQVPAHHATPSAQQLEDDLRKFLKLDLVSKG